jgi:hypothetical protein
MTKINDNAYDVLGDMLSNPPAPAKPKAGYKHWEPRLTEPQRELYYDESKFILCWGEKGGAKTWGILNKLVNHLYENQNALAIIGVRVRSMANKGGAWDKLTTFILPEWGKGRNLTYSDVQRDSQHNELIWVQNRFGTWCCVVLISCPNASQLKDRMPGYEPSFVFWDELTKCDSKEYFTAPAIQLGRRPGPKGNQQYVAACNPEGESHWVYQTWFVEPYDVVTAEKDQDFKEIYFPVATNISNLRKGYLESLAKIYRHDSIGAARMIKGEWIDRPSGEALFADIFNIVLHVQPLDDNQQPNRHRRLEPVVDYPIIIGLDPGAVYNAFIFSQWLPIADERTWMFFDEAVTIRRRVNYREFVPIIQRKVQFWRQRAAERSGRDILKVNMPQVWISDNSAFNQYRPGGQAGSFDVLDLERIYEANRAKYSLEPLKIKQCPKPPGSVITRVQLLQNALGDGRVIVSSWCNKVIACMNKLEGTPTEEGEAPDPEKLLTPKRSDYVHTFDGMTYPMLMAALKPTALTPSKATAALITAH